MAELNLPTDPMILLSFINTKLRDFYPSLDALCEDADISREEIIKKLSAIDYTYNAELNKFV
ncbi:MAG: DUF4250 domain-containing protein [Ruminococcus sp.]